MLPLRGTKGAKTKNQTIIIMKRLLTGIGISAVLLMTGTSMPVAADNNQCCGNCDTTKNTPAVVEIYNKVADGTENVYGKTKEGVTEAYDTVAGGTVNAYDTVAGGTVKAYNKVAEGTEDAFNKTKEGTQKAAEKVKEELNKIF